jgi:hypothetical protein
VGAHADLLAPPRGRRGSWVVAGGLLAVLVVLAIGVFIGRASAPEPDVAQSPVTTAGPGPSRVVEGVPVGYARTEAGAVAAAGNYAVVLGSKDNVDPAYVERVYPVFALAPVVDDMLARSRDFASTVADPSRLAADPALVLRAAPMGYRVESYTADEARVAVWSVVTGAGTAELPLATAWGTERLTLRWEQDDWRIAAIDRESGPTPIDGAATPAETVARMNGFVPFTYSASVKP